MRPLPTTTRPSLAVRRRGWLVGALVTATLALAGCDDITSLASRDRAPDEFRFSIGGYGVGSWTWETRGDTLVFQRIPWEIEGPQDIDSVRVVPTAEEWRGFWRAVDQGGVRRWRGSYEAPEIADGAGWGLRLTDEGLRVRSQGSNAYPNRWGIPQKGEQTADFRAFLAALEELTGAPV